MMMVSAGRDQPNQIDSQTQSRHCQQLVRVHLWRLHQPLDGFKDDKDRDEDEEQAVSETG